MDAFGPDQLAGDMDNLMGDGNVFGKAKATRYFDGVWQQDPQRIVKYRPSILHAYGWLPFIIWRNMKATVFADLYLVAQVLFMCFWCLFIELTAQWWTEARPTRARVPRRCLTPRVRMSTCKRFSSSSARRTWARW